MSTDVNAQFAAQKAAQLDYAAASETRAERQTATFEQRVAAGEMALVGRDTYRVLVGWDRGETFTVTRNAEGAVQAVLAYHGLDLDVDGRAALYTRQPAWHSLGQVVPEGVSSIDEVLKLSHTDFGVELVPSTYEWDGRTQTVADQFTMVRNDTGAALGVVGTKYTPIQNADAFGFMQELVGDDSVTFETAGAIRGGKRVFVSTRLPENIVVDAEGIADIIVPYVVVSNDHTGSKAFKAVVTPWRPECANTERFALRDAVSSWTVRHTASALDKVAEARRTLGMSIKYYGEWAAEETALAQSSLLLDEFSTLLADLWPTTAKEDDSVRAQNIRIKRNEALIAGFEAEADRLGKTAYAAERAITDYLDHVAPVRPGRTMTEEIARATRLIEGADDEAKTTAHRQLMKLVRSR